MLRDWQRLRFVLLWVLGSLALLYAQIPSPAGAVFDPAQLIQSIR